MSVPLSVLIPDGEEILALHVARCLAQIKGVKLYILSGTPQTWCRFSRHRQLYKFEPIGADLEERVEIIAEMARRHHIDVLLPVSDEGIEFVATKYPALSRITAISPVPNIHTLRLARNKWTLHEFAVKQQLPVPPAVLVTFTSAFYARLADLEFPVLLKPTSEGGGKGIKRFDDLPALKKYLETQDVEKLRNKYLVESYIPGLDLGLSVLCRRGEILAFTVQRGLAAARFGRLKAMQFIEQERVLEIGQRLLSALNWNGVAHIDMRYDERNGQVKIIELNPRFWGSLPGSLVAGVNFPYLACLAAMNVPFPMPSYRLGKYLHTGIAAKELLLRPLGKSKLNEFTFAETGLKFLVTDPLPEMINWARRTGLLRKIEIHPLPLNPSASITPADPGELAARSSP